MADLTPANAACVIELAAAVVRANYETAGEDISGKQSLWTAIADLEQRLREIGELHD